MPGYNPNGKAVVKATFKDGREITIPREPIEKAGLKIPGFIIRPDNEEIFVEDFPLDTK
jgi:hypothetical protein